jgi:capsular polysaccharide biosynthesis protein
MSKTVLPAAQQAASKVLPSIMTPTGLAMVVGLWFGRGIIFFALKMVLIMFFPFLSPVLWLFGI